jgi:hypothetical protein
MDDVKHLHMVGMTICPQYNALENMKHKKKEKTVTNFSFQF